MMKICQTVKTASTQDWRILGVRRRRRRKELMKRRRRRKDQVMTT